MRESQPRPEPKASEQMNNSMDYTDLESERWPQPDEAADYPQAAVLLCDALDWLVRGVQKACEACNRATEYEPVNRASRWLLAFCALLLFLLFLVNAGRQIAGIRQAGLRFVDPVSVARPTTYYETVSTLEGVKR